MNPTFTDAPLDVPVNVTLHYADRSRPYAWHKGPMSRREAQYMAEAFAYGLEIPTTVEIRPAMSLDLGEYQ